MLRSTANSMNTHNTVTPNTHRGLLLLRWARCVLSGGRGLAGSGTGEWEGENGRTICCVCSLLCLSQGLEEYTVSAPALQVSQET